MITLLLVVFAIAVLVFLTRLAAQRSRIPVVLQDPGKHLSRVDVDAFRNLIDPDEEDYLRQRLAPSEFRKVKIERLQSAVEYLKSVARNASILLIVAQAARESTDPAINTAAERLIENALRLRLFAAQAIPRFYLAMLIPVGRGFPVRVVDEYERVTRQVIMLNLQYPLRNVPAAL